jgi:hypothetical protein
MLFSNSAANFQANLAAPPEARRVYVDWVRSIDTVDQELRLVAAVPGRDTSPRRTAKSAIVDELLDERLSTPTEGPP